MTDNQLKERELISTLSLFTVQLCDGDMTNGNRDQVIDIIIHLTKLLNEYKLLHKIEITNADLWQE
jgi:hypothetical protein|tara:strand:- start:397 stop:594 length:198 start_codon:yes stop_codon:yes gene_type:complete